MAETNHQKPKKPSSSSATANNNEANEGIEIVSSLFPTRTTATATGDEYDVEDPENIHNVDVGGIRIQGSGSQPDMNKPKWKKWSGTTTFLVCFIIFGGAVVAAVVGSSISSTKINAFASTDLIDNKQGQGKSTKVPSTGKSSKAPPLAGKASKTGSSQPSSEPSFTPSKVPSFKPSVSPSKVPSFKPSVSPSKVPSFKPSFTPSKVPSFKPSVSPSKVPSFKPSVSPSKVPSFKPSVSPSKVPSSKPSLSPSKVPSFKPSVSPSKAPSFNPSLMPSKSAQPSRFPSLPASNFSGCWQASWNWTNYNLYFQTYIEQADVGTIIGFVSLNGATFCAGLELTSYVSENEIVIKYNGVSYTLTYSSGTGKLSGFINANNLGSPSGSCACESE